MRRTKRLLAMLCVLIGILALDCATALADDDYSFLSSVVYQMKDENLDMESASACFVVESGDTIRSTSASITLKNNTEQDIEFINATLLIADEEEIDRVCALPRYPRIIEMLRRKYRFEWYTRVEYFGSESTFPRTLKPGETETVMFFIDESIYPTDMENVACLLQVYAMPK